MEESKRENTEAEDPAGKPNGDEPYPELPDMVRDAITRELSSQDLDLAKFPEEKPAESRPAETRATTKPDPGSGGPASDRSLDPSKATLADSGAPVPGRSLESPEATRADSGAPAPGEREHLDDPTDAAIEDEDPELAELREILLGDAATGRDGGAVSQLPRLISSVRRELRGAFEQQTEVVRAHSRDTRAILEELLSQVRTIAETLNALESDPSD